LSQNASFLSHAASLAAFRMQLFFFIILNSLLLCNRLKKWLWR